MSITRPIAGRITQPIPRALNAPGVGGGGFSPSDGASLEAWYDPSDLSTLFQDQAGTTPVTAAGQVVGRMLDKSGLGRHKTWLTDKPTYQVDGNGKSYISGDGTNDQMQVASSTALFKFMHDGTGGAVWFAGSAGAGNTSYMGTDGGTNTGFRIFRIDSTGRPLFVVTGGGVNVISCTPASGSQWPANTVAVIGATHITQTGNDASLYVNGVSVASSAQINPPSTANSFGNLILGLTATVIWKFYGGAYYSAIPDAALRAKLDTYYADKGGVAL